MELLERLLDRTGEDGRPASELTVATTDAAEMEAVMQTFVGHATALLDDAKLAVEARTFIEAYKHGDPRRLEDAAAGLTGRRASGAHSPAALAFFEWRSRLSKNPSNAERGRQLVRGWRMRDAVLPRARAFARLLVRCEEAIAEDAERDSILSFSDVLRATRDVLRDNPDIARESSSEVLALLVDEFQDTSALQRDLVHLLWDRDPGARRPGTVPAAGDLRAQGLLIVGDRKQSIYAFRGADVAVFAQLSVELAGAPARVALGIAPGLVHEPSSPVADFVALQTNRRGAPELLDFANAWSRCSLVPESNPAELYEIDYAPSTEDLIAPASAMHVPSSARTHWLRPAVLPERRCTTSIQEAETIAARISCIVWGAEMTVRGAPARFRDIAVLAERRSMLDAAAYALARAGIPHVVSGTGFYGAREVRDMMAMLACLLDPDDSLARIEVLRSPWAGVTNRTLVGLTDLHAGVVDVAEWGVGGRRHLVDAEDRASVARLGKVIASLRRVIDRVGAGEALREAVRAVNLEETLLILPRGEQRVANVEKVLSLADRATDPRAFLQRLWRAAESEQREGEAVTFSDEDDAVRLLTVHGSKGLAFPIVFLPEVGATVRHASHEAAMVRLGVSGAPNRVVLRIVDPGGMVHDPPSYAAAKVDLARRESAERRRLRYVATTRAAEAMFFVGDRTAPKVAPSPAAASGDTVAILERLAMAPPSGGHPLLVIETGPSLSRKVASTERAGDPPPLVQPPMDRRVGGPVALEAVSLIEAGSCARLFQLVRQLGIPSSATAPKTSEFDLGAALASVGAWGRRVAAERPLLTFGERVVLATREPSTVVVEGSIDVMVTWPDEAKDVLVVVAEPIVSERYQLYASVLAHATLSRSPASRVRVGLVALTAPPMEEPHWMTPSEMEVTLRGVQEAARRVREASSARMAARVDVEICQRIHCAFLPACYPTPEKAEVPVDRERRQLAFEFAQRLEPSRRRRRRR